jgi:hypothetical protein
MMPKGKLLKRKLWIHRVIHKSENIKEENSWEKEDLQNVMNLLIWKLNKFLLQKLYQNRL